MTMALPAPSGAKGSAASGDGWDGRHYIRFGMICLLILVFGIGGWIGMVKVASAIISPGQLRVESNKQVVQHIDGGIVGKILVRDGDTVEAGEVLIRLDDTVLKSDLSVLESQLYELMARRGRLEAAQSEADKIEFDPEILEVAKTNPEVDKLVKGQVALFNARRESTDQEIQLLEERKVQIQDQSRGTQAQLDALDEQLRLINEELEGQKRLLAKGLAQANRVLSLEREAARLSGQVGDLTARIAQLNGQTSQVEIEALRMKAKLREDAISELRELGFKELELKEQRNALREKLKRLDIRAPRPGRIIDMNVHALHSVIRPAEPILYVVPNDTGLVVDARIEPRNIDSINLGQDATLRFSAFDANTTPEINGVVTNVSADSIVDEKTGVAYYKAEVTPKPGEIEKLKDHELIAGMPVEIYIQLGQRTTFNYMAKPVMDFFNRAMREE